MRRLSLVLCLLCLAAKITTAQEMPERAAKIATAKADTLLGLENVDVSVSIDKEIEAAVSPEAVQATTELRLRQSGIEVAKNSLNDFVVMCVTLVDTDNNNQPTGEIIYNCNITLDSPVTILGPRRGIDVGASAVLAYATIWKTGEVGVVGRARVEQLRGTIADMTSKFLNDYLAVNSHAGNPNPSPTSDK
jgi:hypothetical protein